MRTTLESIGTELQSLKRDIKIIKKALLEDEKLTDWAKNALLKARGENEDTYTELKEL